MNRFLLITTFSITALLFIGCKSNQPMSADKQAQITKLASLINNSSFTFIPTSITPMRGNTIQLSGGYSLKIASDQINSYLPYVGRVYSLPSNPMSIGLDFKLKDFVYTVEQKKNGNFIVFIKPKDFTQVDDRGIEMTLTISSNSYATLFVNFMNRQSVSYYGYIE